MINANELRIGNWVKDSLGYLVIGVNAKVEFASAYEPIPLTPEILEKCGAIVYEFDNGEQNQYRIKERLFVIRDGDIVDYGSSVIIKHLHQLQNLYFALCGEELNYTP